MTDCVGRPRCPTELKLPRYLRIFGRTACFDEIEELSGINGSTMHSFSHQFSKQGREELYPIHVKMPSRLEELIEIEAAYASIGMSGACRYMDVVHIALGTCPAGLSNLMTGKEQYLSIRYNMMSDYLVRALALMPGAYGSINDQIIVKFHEDVEDMKTTNKLFTEYVYEMKNEQGRPINMGDQIVGVLWSSSGIIIGSCYDGGLWLGHIK